MEIVFILLHKRNSHIIKSQTRVPNTLAHLTPDICLITKNMPGCDLLLTMKKGVFQPEMNVYYVHLV